MAEGSFNKTLAIRSIEHVALEETKYIDDRRKGLIKSLKTPWEKYNDVSMGGIEWHTMHTIAGASGSGKTAILNQMETDLIALNPDEDLEVLSFNFEMLARNLVGRKYSKALGKTVQQIHSGKKGYDVSDDDFHQILAAQEKVRKMPIFYVDEAGTVDDIKNTIIQFAKKNPKKGLIVTLDHAVLVNAKQGEAERVILVELTKMFKKAIKYFARINKNFSVIILSQLNRHIEEMDRVGEPGIQNYPQKKDIFGGDALYQMSDIVMVTMNPYQLGLETYGPHRWETKGRLYFHFIKVREGEPVIAVMQNKLFVNEVKDLDLSGQMLNMNEG
tara:strand:+ start:1318 stop:2307 length:990 start_codon:yes stop_codon:yes gene_type:complete